MKHEFAASYGLTGRPRRAKSQGEGARLNVTRAIHAAMRRIGAQHRALGQHLASTVKTGLFSSYEPDPRVPIDWHC
jgi:hypothetical protein